MSAKIKWKVRTETKKYADDLIVRRSTYSLYTILTSKKCTDKKLQMIFVDNIKLVY